MRSRNRSTTEETPSFVERLQFHEKMPRIPLYPWIMRPLTLKGQIAPLCWLECRVVMRGRSVGENEGERGLRDRRVLVTSVGDRRH